MSEPKFEPVLDWDCLKDIIADVRSASISVLTVKKGLWVAGCALELFSPADNPVISEAGHVEADRSLLALCDELEAVIPAEGAFADSVKINPATVIMIVQLVWKLIQAFKK